MFTCLTFVRQSTIKNLSPRCLRAIWFYHTTIQGKSDLDGRIYKEHVFTVGVIDFIVFAPEVIERSSNSITFLWKQFFCENETTTRVIKTPFKLQVLDHLNEWKTIYFGYGSRYKVERLAPCVCYSFRTTCERPERWVYFKAATENIGPFTLAMHIERAVRPILLNTENRENKTPLLEAIDVNDIQMVQLLISLGANINKPLEYGKRTPLMIAVFKGHLDIASLLMEKGANISAVDVNGLNLLHYAVDSNELANVTFALNTDLDVNDKDCSGWTPLLRAAILGCSDVILKVLLEHGADVNVNDKFGLNYKKQRALP
ncbi:fibronectin type 3 and ankyrin repeat domains protein 1 isoform X2 [Cylas formicarius]|uniref:fibronectin type 3 and ankyrin repeat domains protein 1 isoform X2 n=1 Tax=Cylas formicarius TaxID=197179 RepID=UPI0029586627|nr:fibronectin type 3 and ankyrin repeat domains protein 1 isoform X2 [Cylas formicarius]